MNRVTDTEKEDFLHLVKEVVKSDPGMFKEIVNACSQAVHEKLATVNELRVEAETSLCSAYDLIPESERTKHPSILARIKKVLKNSGLLKGTKFAEELDA